LDSLIMRNFPVELVVNGDPPLGYRKGIPTVSPDQVSVSGPETQVMKVAHIRTTLDISGQRETKEITLPVEAVSETGDVIDNVTVTPRTVKVTMPISLEGGYKNVVVKVVTQGQVPAGYRLTNISVTPPNVTIFSADPLLVNNIPGYVETKSLSLNGLKEDTDFRLGLNLPKGVTLVGEQSVLVQVGVAPIEGSLTVNLPVETLGLPPNLAALISPATVDVILTGPLPVLDTLTAGSFRVVVNLTGLEQGIYQIKPVIDLAPDQINVVSILPETVEVTIAPAPTSTPTLTPGRSTPVPINPPTSTPTPRPTPIPIFPPTRTPTPKGRP
jgi:YbbR domain-containing protein